MSGSNLVPDNAGLSKSNVAQLLDNTNSDDREIGLNEIYSQLSKLIKLQELQMLYIQEVTGLEFNKGDLDE